LVQSIISINHGAKGEKKKFLNLKNPFFFFTHHCPFFFVSLKIGIIAWDDPTPHDIKSSASLLALALPSMSVEFILNPSVEMRRVMVVDSVDFGVWMTVVERERGGGTSMRSTRVLVLGANMNESEVMIELDRLGVGMGVGGQVEQVLDSGAKLVVDQDEGEGEGEGEDKKKTKMRLMFTPLGSGGWIFDF